MQPPNTNPQPSRLGELQQQIIRDQRRSGRVRGCGGCAGTLLMLLIIVAVAGYILARHSGKF